MNYYPIRDYPDIRKKRITLRHLLTMSAGLDTRDSYRYDFQGLMQMMRTSDWDKFILALPMKAAPGSRFEYSNSVTYLIASILQDRTGRDALSFAQQHLFRPMGIADTDVGWRKSPKGICLGWGGIRMKPLDLAKFGLLYLNNGRWNKQQLVPEAWVKDSTCNQINALTLCDGYGYQWWIDNDGHYMALGYGGQYLFVLPAKNMVVVVNSAMAGGDFFVPQMLLKRFILPAANSPTPLKENKKDQTRLKKKLNLLANPKPSPVPPLPKTALSISGKRFQFAPNSLGLDQIEFSFQKGKPEALLNLSVPFGAFQVAVGLDGVHRIKNAIGLIQAHKGTWLDESSFVVHRESINFTQRARVVFRFRGDTLTVSAEQVFSDNYELNARMVK
ncbi:MAG: serine hydrolase [bacterium]|nr:serine hydrolase [bacterium]